MNQTTQTFCANHPSAETMLRCNQCDKYICARCAMKMPTGYRCRECVKGHQKKFETAYWRDYVLGFLVAMFLTGLASFLVTLVAAVAGFFAWLAIIFGAPIVARLIADAIGVVTGRRRSKKLFITILVGAFVGALPVIIFEIFIFDIFGLVFQGIYLLIALPFIYQRVSGIQLFK